MANDSGIKVENRRSILQKELKVDFKSLLLAVGKGAVNVGFLQWDDLAENGVELLESLGLETKPEEIAGLLIVRSMKQAIANLIKEYEASLREKPENSKDLSNQINSAISNQELVINSDFFEHPEQLFLVSEIQTAFAEWLKAFVEKEIDAEKISSSFPAYFVEALNEEWLTRNQEYSVIQEILDTPFTQANKRQQQWLRYRAWLQKQIEEPMFAEAFGLKQVYVPLRAYYVDKIKLPENEGIERSLDRGTENKRRAVKLQESLDKWLTEQNKDDAIRLITGGPGSGKSSFSKIFAAQRAAKGDIQTLFIPLHKFSHGDDLVKAIGEFAQTNCFLSHNPIERDNEDLRLLIIFDGLDELSMQGKIAENAAKDFVEAVRFLVSQFNSYKTRLQVIISGREVVMQANHKQRYPHQLLYLLPYFLKSGKQYYIDIDEENILQEDQRQAWWRNYGKAKGKNYDGLPDELDRDNLVDITAQPLLNYLMALSFERDKLQFTAETNLNEIYADLLEAVYERGYEKHVYRPLEGIRIEEFIGILEEIALSCWHGNGRTTTVKEIENHCAKSGLSQILINFQNSFEQDSSACITRLLAAFYFRESGGIRGQEKTFEFTHKSFGEYLTANRIVEEVRYIYEALEERKNHFRKGYDEVDALVRWANLCGLSPISEYLFDFVWDEIELIYAEEPELVKNWQKMLCHLIEVMLANGMPMEKLDPRPNYQEEKRQARNAEESLLAVLNACARTTKEISQINWHSKEALGSWIASLQPQRTGIKNTLTFQCLSFLDLENSILYIRDFHLVNFKNSHLQKAKFYSANLEGANLEGANLEKAILQRANLQGANLEGANLERANLERAILQRAILQRANLEGAHLEAANLRRANLEGAHLRRANLQGANLQGTILEGKDIAEITVVRN
ncbi:MAG: pentapeptide repeat-containing protein [Xenococcus sp. MO_188.B8]|nr:pentapeptide repeat-containing protein [Xenococcus sp. MO_188.B8]